MQLTPSGQARTPEGRRIVETERAVVELERRLAAWDRERAAVVSRELGTDPFALVSRTWPDLAAIGATSAASDAAPLSPAAIEAEYASMRLAGIGKLTVGGISAFLLVALPLTLILNVLT